MMEDWVISGIKSSGYVELEIGALIDGYELADSVGGVFQLVTLIIGLFSARHIEICRTKPEMANSLSHFIPMSSDALLLTKTSRTLLEQGRREQCSIS